MAEACPPRRGTLRPGNSRKGYKGNGEEVAQVEETGGGGPDGQGSICCSLAGSQSLINFARNHHGELHPREREAPFKEEPPTLWWRQRGDLSCKPPPQGVRAASAAHPLTDAPLHTRTFCGSFILLFHGRRGSRPRLSKAQDMVRTPSCMILNLHACRGSSRAGLEPRRLQIRIHPEPCNRTLLGNRVSANVIRGSVWR